MSNKEKLSEMKNVPETIFLQIGEDGEGVKDFKEFSEVSWCVDNIHGNDIEYVLKSKAEQEMIRFVEWIQESKHSMLLGCCKKEDVGKWVYPGGVVDTTQQLLNKFRESLNIPKPEH